MSAGDTGSFRAAGGFTLVELLIALTLLGVMVVLLFDGMRFGSRASETLSARIDAGEQVRLTQAFLRRQLAQAQPFLVDETRSGGAVAFTGSAQEMRFVAPLPGRIGAAGMYWFRLYTAQAGERREFLVSYALYQPESWQQFGEASPKSTVLLDDVRELEFSYFDTDGGGAGTWTERWEEQDRLPALVRVDLRPAGEAAAPWPELVAATRVAPPRGSRARRRAR